MILSADQRNRGLWRDQNALLMLAHYAIQSSIMSRGRPDTIFGPTMVFSWFLSLETIPRKTGC